MQQLKCNSRAYRVLYCKNICKFPVVATYLCMCKYYLLPVLCYCHLYIMKGLWPLTNPDQQFSKISFKPFSIYCGFAVGF